MLNKIGKHYGLKKNQILEIFRDQKNTVQKIPVNFDQKINQLFEMVKLMMVDNVVDKEEMDIAEEMAENLRFEKGIINSLIEFNKNGNTGIWNWEQFKKDARDFYEGE